MTNAAPPLVSVIVPVFNGARFLADALASILEQRVEDLEIVVVDDGSTDGSRELAEGTAGVRVLSQKNRGPAGARNAGIAAARGDVLAFLDSDDLWPPGRLERDLAALAASPTAAGVIGRFRFLLPGPDGSFVACEESLFGHQLGGALLRHATFEDVGPFDEGLRFAEDLDWFLRARERNVPIRPLPEVSLLYRRHGGSLTSGRTLVEQNVIGVLKRSLDRRRGRRAPL
jgi:glycosyltransferase involved in cell wall biosynthesis